MFSWRKEKPSNLEEYLSEEHEIMSCCFSYRFGLTLAAALLLAIGGIAHAEVATEDMMAFAVIAQRMASV
jgi:hypothetical protein